jgi:Cyclophilin type peptidyl-prolyl cis-trans isomerase/CLD
MTEHENVSIFFHVDVGAWIWFGLRTGHRAPQGFVQYRMRRSRLDSHPIHKQVYQRVQLLPQRDISTRPGENRTSSLTMAIGGTNDCDRKRPATNTFVGERIHGESDAFSFVTTMASPVSGPVTIVPSQGCTKRGRKHTRHEHVNTIDPSARACNRRCWTGHASRCEPQSRERFGPLAVADRFDPINLKTQHSTAQHIIPNPVTGPALQTSKVDIIIASLAIASKPTMTSTTADAGASPLRGSFLSSPAYGGRGRVLAWDRTSSPAAEKGTSAASSAAEAASTTNTAKTQASMTSSSNNTPSYVLSHPTRRISSPAPSVTSLSSASSSSSSSLSLSSHHHRASLPASTSYGRPFTLSSALTTSASHVVPPPPPLSASLTSTSNASRLASLRTSSAWISDGNHHPHPVNDVSESTATATYWEDCAVVEIKPTPPSSSSSRPNGGPKRGGRGGKTAAKPRSSDDTATFGFKKAAAALLLLVLAVALGVLGRRALADVGRNYNIAESFHPIKHMHKEIERAQEQYRDLMARRDRLVRDALSENGAADVANGNLEQKVQMLQRRVADKTRELRDEFAKRQQSEDELFARLKQIRTAHEQEENRQRQKRRDLVQLIRTLAYRQFGTGPHEVEFAVRFHGSSSTSRSTSTNGPAPLERQLASSSNATVGPYEEGYFVVRMARLDGAMAVSSFWFLQQVDRGLWDRTSFSLNAPHMLLAQPVSVAEEHHAPQDEAPAPSTVVSRLPEMEAAGLGRLPFVTAVPGADERPNDGDPTMREARYTLSYGASPATAGSFFFIAKRDGTLKSNLHGDGQNVFARVVDGFDVVDRIAAMDTNPVDFRLTRPVEIVSVRIVDAASSSSSASEDDEEDELHSMDALVSTIE